MAPFQTSVNTISPVGTEGAFASSNPRSVVVSPNPGLTGTPVGLVADIINGLVVGAFAWLDPVNASQLLNYAVGATIGSIIPSVPAGFVANQLQALITVWLGQNTMLIPPGIMASAYDRGDFWARCGFANAAIGNKVFANIFSGKVIPGAAGSFPAYPSGTAAAFTASFATTVMTVSAVASGTLGVGQLIIGAGIPANTRIASLGSGVGLTGTYNLSTTPGTVSSGAYTSTTADSVGGASVTASFATSVMTVTAVADGVLAVGQLISASGVAAGTYITSLGTGTGGTGTYNLSTTPGTVGSAAGILASAWIETPWYFKTACNQGELAKIGVRN